MSSLTLFELTDEILATIDEIVDAEIERDPELLDTLYAELDGLYGSADRKARRVRPCNQERRGSRRRMQSRSRKIHSQSAGTPRTHAPLERGVENGLGRAWRKGSRGRQV